VAVFLTSLWRTEEIALAPPDATCRCWHHREDSGMHGKSSRVDHRPRTRGYWAAEPRFFAAADRLFRLFCRCVHRDEGLLSGVARMTGCETHVCARARRVGDFVCQP